MRKRLRLSPAMVIAMIALLVSLSGVGYAATKIGTADIENGAVTARKLHKSAVVKAKIRNGAVTTNKLADGAVTPEKLSGVLFATVAPADSTAQIVHGFGATDVTRVVNGSFIVTFDRPVTNCTWLATYGQPDNSFVDAGWATVRGRADPNQVGVVLRDAAGAQSDGVGFHVAVFCP